MFLKTARWFKSILSNYPKKHIYIVLGCLPLFIIILFLSNLDLKSKFYEGSLKSKILLKEVGANKKLVEKYISTSLRETIIRPNDSLFSILEKLRVNKENILKLINSKNSHHFSDIKIGETISIRINDLNNEVIYLRYIKDYKSGIEATLIEGEYKITPYKLETEKQKIFKKVIIKDSLYSSGLKAGIPDSVIMDLVYIFGWDLDFVHDIRPGDTFSLIYEEIYVEGIKQIDGDILIAEFINKGKVHTALRFKLSSGLSEYFNLLGRNVKKAFLRSPVKFSYVSSKYNLQRKHPILHKIRAHTGVDYAARKGTPVRATGEGTVSYVGLKGGYGNLVEIKHSEDYSTRYAHLNSFHPNIKMGKKVRQSSVIGYVGNSGLATGSHLHYEFHVNGKHTDPLKVIFPNAKPINSIEKERFLAHSNKLFKELRNYQSFLY